METSYRPYSTMVWEPGIQHEREPHRKTRKGRRGALTSPSSIHDFAFGAGLLVLQVIVQEHFPQQVALPRQINVMRLPAPAPEQNKAERPRAVTGRVLPARAARAEEWGRGCAMGPRCSPSHRTCSSSPASAAASSAP